MKECSSKEGCHVKDQDLLDYCMAEGLLVMKHVNLQRPAVEQSPVPSLRYLELQITDRCNLRCGHCYIGDPSGNELGISEIGKVMDEFQKMQGLRVMITGGEPLLHTDFNEINRMLPDYFMRKVLFTNGLLLTPEILDRINVDEIQISIDGLESGHDALRGKGMFRKAMNALELCTEKGFAVSVATMVHRSNINDLEEMQAIFTKAGVLEWTVDIPCPSGRMSGDSRFFLSPEDGGKYLKYGFGKGLHGGGEGFGCGLHLMSVMADGKAAKCTFYSDRPAGMISEGLETCWKRIQPVLLSDLDCNCEHIESCRGGCRYRAERLGDPSGKDLYRCHLYDIIK
jgi:radical SAM protein with 4Fe4S-binding SPASM domain